ncbi:hypothetical protein NQ314_019562 [Rhamnusium bicolor]|uniref:Uncharacterized protein n=1 Tax=Rhamnusium bicolor TaxID=1586634 RepID=A0AAV8WMV7_9CUCU|nr:hypothetical protein NQ314_019562 [Rhamnusium bicolor]
MARYLKPKLHWELLQQQNRRLSNKLDIAPISNALARPTEEDEISEDQSHSRLRYTVCRDRTTSSQKFVFDRRNLQKKLAGLQDQYETLEPPAETEIPMPNISPSTKGYQTFAASTLYKNVTLPLKSSKLANPFPEPVKVMPSHTVSDQEKADQMQAESRVPRFSPKSKRMN